MNKMVKAVIFDFWGTLVENGTYSPLKQTYKILRLRMSFGEFVETFEKAFMMQEFESQTDGLKKALQALKITPKDFIIEKLIAIWNMNKLFAKPYEDTVQCLEELKNQKIKIALMSNCPKDSTEYILEKYDLNKYFDAIALSWKEKLLKTDKKLFDELIEKMGVDRNDVLVVGDSLETDIAGAEKAKLKSLLIDRRNTRTYQPKILKLDELKKHL